MRVDVLVMRKKIILFMSVLENKKLQLFEKLLAKTTTV